MTNKILINPISIKSGLNSARGRMLLSFLLILVMILPVRSAGFPTGQETVQTSPHLPGMPAAPIYQLDMSREVWLTAGGVALLTAGVIALSNLDPLSPAEIDALNKNDINRLDRELMGSYRKYFSGDVVLYSASILSLSLLTLEPVREDWQTYAMMGAEVILLQSGLNLLTKSLTGRTRPYAYDPQVPLDEKTQKDTRLSFYSGHTGTTAALSFFTARIFTDHIENESHKKYLWIGAALMPALAGYLRVSSANHFFTDTVIGYSIGASIGYFIPELHKHMTNGQLSLQQTASGDGLELHLTVKF